MKKPIRPSPNNATGETQSLQLDVGKRLFPRPNDLALVVSTTPSPWLLP
ncbi:MAG: hypothetical protein OSA11_02395 [Candidatus Nanopelagicales bacterium]|nr:hypothetical protein [Candidatus Nanopelagicales bacterium]